VLVNARKQLGRRFTLGGVHAHIERGVSSKGKSSAGLIELVRRDAQVHEHTHHGLTSDKRVVTREHLGEVGECSVNDEHSTSKVNEMRARRDSSIGIAIDTQQAQLRGDAQYCRSVTAAAQRGVNKHAGTLTGEQLDNFIFEHWYVVVVLGHLQPFNRQDARVGGGGVLSRLDDCQAAHGPRLTLLLHSHH
jgi:hypothetical protein